MRVTRVFSGETPLFDLYSTVERLNDLCPDMMVGMETRVCGVADRR